MKLSERLKIDNDCGDFGDAIEGYSEKAKALEDRIEDLEDGSDVIHGMYSDQSQKMDRLKDKNKKLVKALKTICNQDCGGRMFLDKNKSMLEEEC